MHKKEIRIKKWAWLIGAILLLSVPGWAQETFPRAEIYGGYSFATVDASRNANRVNAHGWQTNISGNLNKYFGVTADIAGHYGDIKQSVGGFGASDSSVRLRTHQFLIGPRVTARVERITAFGHILAGFAHTSRGNYSVRTEEGSRLVVALVDNKFAMAFGTGVDFGINKNIAIRAIQVDYVPIRRGQGFFGRDGRVFDAARWSHNVRLGAGVVFTLGSS